MWADRDEGASDRGLGSRSFHWNQSHDPSRNKVGQERVGPGWAGGSSETRRPGGEVEI